jgi:hypothetical protein
MDVTEDLSKMQATEPLDDAPISSTPPVNPVANDIKTEEIADGINDTERTNLELKISRYLIAYPEKLRAFSRVRLEKYNNNELAALCSKMRTTVTTKMSMDGMINGYKKAIAGLEMISVSDSKFPVKLKGLSQNVCDPDTIDLVKLCMIEHDLFIDAPPAGQLAFHLVSTCFALHGMNSLGLHQINAPSATGLTAEQTTALNEKYSEL